MYIYIYIYMKYSLEMVLMKTNYQKIWNIPFWVICYASIPHHESFVTTLKTKTNFVNFPYFSSVFIFYFLFIYLFGCYIYN
jgi:hypothetical protein